MNYCQFHCPKCFQPGMGNYIYYDSRILNDGQKHWIFYNIETEPSGWVCWALLYECGVKVEHWWDPCGCCFNPCTVARTHVTVYQNAYGDRYVETSYWEHFCCCFLFLMLCYFLYMIYFSIFIWYDIYNAFCNVKRVKMMCIGNGQIKVDDNDLHWNNIKDYTFTENWWMNFPNLFFCYKCTYRGVSFRDFIGPGHINVPVVGSKDEVINTGINSNI